MVSYQPLIEVSARRSLHALPRRERAELRRVLKDVAATKQPSHHAKAKQLQGFEHIFRIRVGATRAVCKLDKPHLLILKIGKRRTVYNDIDELDVSATADVAEV